MNAVIPSSSMSNNEHKTHALICYILVAIGLFTAIPLFVGAIWAMIKKKSALGTLHYSHFVNVTRTFWWSLFWTIIGSILSSVGIGFAILAG